MTLDLGPLDTAMDRLEGTLESVASAATDFPAGAEAVAEMKIAELMAAMRMPALSVSTNDLEGVQAALALFERLEGFSDEVKQAQGEAISRIGAFDEAVGRIVALSQAFEEMLEQRQAAFDELRDAQSSLVSQLEEDSEQLVSGSEEVLMETFTEHLTETAEETFSEIEDLLEETFTDFRGLADEIAKKIEDKAHEVAEGFGTNARDTVQEAVEARARQLLEAQVAEVIQDLAISQSVSTMTQQLNTAIASAAPNIVVALKAVSSVQTALELVR